MIRKEFYMLLCDGCFLLKYLIINIIIIIIILLIIIIIIVSITKCSIAIGSPRAYLIRNWRLLMWVSNYSCTI